MLQFTVQDMTCSHCTGVITKAVKAVDANARLEFDVPMHLVKIETAAEAGRIDAAIRDAGYTPLPAGVV
jgi:copper chaperone